MTERKQYFIKIHERAVEVSHEVYLAYFRMERQERYLKEKDRKKGTVLYSDLDTDKLLGVDIVPDPCASNTEDMVVMSILSKKLHKCLKSLPKAERDLIQALYFNGLTEGQLSQKTGIHCMTIHSRKVCILRKLKKLLEN